MRSWPCEPCAISTATTKPAGTQPSDSHRNCKTTNTNGSGFASAEFTGLPVSLATVCQKPGASVVHLNHQVRKSNSFGCSALWTGLWKQDSTAKHGFCDPSTRPGEVQFRGGGTFRPTAFRLLPSKRTR
eukprot:3746500-Rhodomonas_salina.1